MRTLTLTSSIAIFTGLACGTVFGLPRLQARLAKSLSEQPRSVRIDWPAREGAATGSDATWMPTEVRDELTALVTGILDRDSDPFRVDSLTRISSALLETGWFEGIESVRRERDANGQPLVHIAGTWRIPAAVVRYAGVDYLVSWDAHVLPIAYPQGTSNQRAIVGVQKEPPRRAGEVVRGETWPGDDVRAGLQVLAMISSRPWASQIAGVDIGEYENHRRLSLVTTRQSRIVWGGAPSDTIPGEVGASVKLARLDALAARYEGKVDANERVVEIAGPVTLVDKSATAEASAIVRPGAAR
jgi:hypothetical protein